MPFVIPGRPALEQSSKCIALASRHGQLYICFITAQAAFIFRDAHELIQIIRDPFEGHAISSLAFDRRSGHLAISSGTDIRIYDELYTFTPRAAVETTNGSDVDDEVKISWTYGRSISAPGSSIRSLSWGLDAELLVGNDRLLLYRQSRHTHEARNIWDFPLSTEVERAVFSPDASLVASYGRYDKLVKVWRRLSDRVSAAGIKTSDFDFIYLPHARVVEDVKWRQPFHEDLLVDNIMYSTSIDQTFRAWASDIPHDSHLLTLHETVPLECDFDYARKIAVVLDDDVFSWALAKANKKGCDNSDQVAAQSLLKRLSLQQPEVILTFGIDGSMDAYALNNLGSRNAKPSTQELFFSTVGLSLFDGKSSTSGAWMTADIQRSGAGDILLFFGSAAGIDVYETSLFDLFSPSPVLQKLTSLRGHDQHIASLKVLVDGVVESKDHSGEVKHWKALEGTVEEVPLVKNLEAMTEYTVPEHVSSVIGSDFCCVATSEECTALVHTSNVNEVQIWGSRLITSFSGAPISRYSANDEVVSLVWNSSKRSDTLALCTKSLLIMLQRNTVSRDRIQIWSPVWSYDLSQFSAGQISRVVFGQPSLAIVSAGTQMFTFTDNEWRHNTSDTITDSDIPIYHPEFLSQLLKLGKLDSARKILLTLHDRLVSSSDATSIKYDLGLSDDAFFDPQNMVAKNRSRTARYSALFGDAPEEESQSILSQSKGESLKSLLTDLDVKGLTLATKARLNILISALVKIEADEESLDRMGQRFYLAYTISQLSIAEGFAEADALDDDAVYCAARSEKQDILLTLVMSSVKSLTWKAARAAKIFRWLQDRKTLLEVAETIAKAEFIKGETRDPVSASIWYLALHKKGTLLSLWRMSGTHPEHNLTTKILANDFEQAKWKTTANKNAYALVGRRRFEYAAAWFLLAGSVKDAVQLCIRKVEDLDLALAVARIWDGGREATTRDLLMKDYQDNAQQRGSRILSCWAYELAGDHDQAMQTATTPFGLQTCDDPAILSVYADLRERRGPCSVETEFIQYVRYLLDVRGCQCISKYIERTWEYKTPNEPTNDKRATEEMTMEQFKEKKKEILVEAPQAVYQEPTMDSFAAFDF